MVLLYIAQFSPQQRVLSLRGHMTSNNKTVSRRKSLSGQQCKIHDIVTRMLTDDRRCCMLPFHVFLFVPYTCIKSLNDWSIGNQLILFPSNLNVSLGCASGKH